MAAGDIVQWTGAVSSDPAVAGNWSTAAVPADGEVIVIPQAGQAAMAGGDLTVGATLQFRGFRLKDGFAFAIGSLATYLQVELTDTAVYYDAEIDGGGGQVFLDVDNYHEIRVQDAVAGASGQFGVNLIGLHDADDTGGRGTIYVNLVNAAGTVGIGANPNEDMEVNAIEVARGIVTIGPKVTENDDAAAPDLTVTGGTVYCHCPLGTLTVTGGTVYLMGAATVTALNCWGGTVYYESDGTCTTAKIGGTVDCTRDGRARTFTTTHLYRGGSLKDPDKTITFTNAPNLQGCSLADVSLELGKNLTIARGAIP